MYSPSPVDGAVGSAILPPPVVLRYYSSLKMPTVAVMNVNYLVCLAVIEQRRARGHSDRSLACLYYVQVYSKYSRMLFNFSLVVSAPYDSSSRMIPAKFWQFWTHARKVLFQMHFKRMFQYELKHTSLNHGSF